MPSAAGTHIRSDFVLTVASRCGRPRISEFTVSMSHGDEASARDETHLPEQ